MVAANGAQSDPLAFQIRVVSKLAALEERGACHDGAFAATRLHRALVRDHDHGVRGIPRLAEPEQWPLRADVDLVVGNRRDAAGVGARIHGLDLEPMMLEAV